ncbi:MAG: VPLPA-CTERM-specific exosortase XrtD [Bradyrhizobium sp.]|nr:VPLPA-CTERM-specific exosortase XrtD [Bradyrhizobium sp.]
MACAVIASYGEPVLEAVRRWGAQDEYSHGYLVPAISAWLLWTRRQAIMGSLGSPSWTGLLVGAFAGAIHIIGELSALFTLSQIAMIMALFGAVLCIGGTALLRVTFVPIAFLLFAIPLPYFLDSTLSWRLQLLSSQLGVTFIRLIDVPVYLEGNVIDLGTYKLQVVEACSGLRYLYPLMSLGFIVAWMFNGPMWQRAVLLLSPIPIAIVMNSVRLLVVALLVNQWGPEQAKGPMHLFEGWVIFLACAGLLLGEAWILARYVQRKPFSEVFRPPVLTPKRSERVEPARSYTFMIAYLALLCATALAGVAIGGRQELIPERTPFVQFPSTLGAWQGRSSSLEPQVEHFLGLTDYVLSDYARADTRNVNFYVAYYASQRKGVSPHSPQVCIPGDGWQIADFQRTSYVDQDRGLTVPLNRVVIERASHKQIVYYWFEQRGKRVANEYLSKWHLLADAVYLNRTDGALIRLTTPVYPGETEQDGDKRLRGFMHELLPQMTRFLPSPAS